ncbi:MFS transporter [Schlesneria sp. DSM 10557]|uniref:MFS transporter n=1 Tax=Schlesneria sp. DSM 10557 TaxID=3044399 RepID=UPI00359F35EC
MTESTATNAGLRRTVPLLMLVVACGHFNRISISVIGSERLIPQYGLTPERMGLVYSAFLLSYTLAMLPGGWLIDRYGARAALMFWGFGSVVFVGLNAAASALQSDALALWTSLVVIRSALGIFNAPLHPASAAMVCERVAPRSRAFANGLVTFGAIIGIASTYRVMGSMIDNFDWSTALIISSVVTLIVTLIWTLSTRPNENTDAHRAVTKRPTMSFREISPVLLQRSVICIALSYGAYGYFQYLFFYWIQYFFETIQHLDKSVARDYSTIITGAMGIGMVCGGWLTDLVPQSLSPRLRRAIVPVIGMIASGAVFELGLITSDPQLTFISLAIASALIGACEGPFWTTSVELGGRYGGITGSLMNTVGNLGGTISPYITPWLGALFAARYGEVLGWKMSLAVAGAIVIVGALLWWGIDPIVQTQKTDDKPAD